MAKIMMNQLDYDVIDSLTSKVKAKMFKVYGSVPCDTESIIAGLDDEFIEDAENEIKAYYDGLFDDNGIEVAISKEEYAGLI